jgi:hypothetical protein
METIAWVLTAAALLAGALAGLQIYHKEKVAQAGRLDRLERFIGGSSLKEIDLPPEMLRLTYALDRDTIIDLHNQALAARGAPASKDFEIQAETATSAGLSIWPFTSPPGHGSSPAQQASSEPENDPAQAVLAVEKRLQETRSIHSIDLTSSVDERPLNLLLSTLEHRASEMGMQITAEVKSALRHAWEARNQDLKNDSLANLTGFVKLRADFSINSSDSGDLLLEARSANESQAPKLSTLCKQEHILGTARTVLVPGETVRANCFGIVTRWDEQREILSLLPLAIYS